MKLTLDPYTEHDPWAWPTHPQLLAALRPYLGPTTTAILSAFVEQDRATLDADEVGTLLGLNPYNLNRAMERLIRFDGANLVTADHLAVRSTVEPAQLVRRLRRVLRDRPYPATLQALLDRAACSAVNRACVST